MTLGLTAGSGPAPEFPAGALDPFARLRVAGPVTIFDSKQLFDNKPLQWDDAQTSGAGTSSAWSAARASSLMGVSAGTAGVRVRQTMRRFNYQPGKGQLVLMTFAMGAAAAGITRRVGQFDANNGLFLEQISTGPGFVVRSSVSGAPVDFRVDQANWNLDRLDGSGPSASRSI